MRASSIVRNGYVSIDHAPGAHDDIANAVAGALVTAFRDPGVASFRRPIESHHGCLRHHSA
jgi:hypothetical protein